MEAAQVEQVFVEVQTSHPEGQDSQTRPFVSAVTPVTNLPFGQVVVQADAWLPVLMDRMCESMHLVHWVPEVQAWQFDMQPMQMPLEL